VLARETLCSANLSNAAAKANGVNFTGNRIIAIYQAFSSSWEADAAPKAVESKTALAITLDLPKEPAFYV
jgi:hypothetical protein